MVITEAPRHEGIAGIKARWKALQAQCPQITPFQTWEWQEAWWRAFSARKRLRLLLCHNTAGALVGIFPLYSGFHLGTPLRRLAWTGTGPGDYLGPILLPGVETEAVPAFFEYLDRRLRGWDIADLQQLPPDSPLLAEPRPWPHRPADTQAILPMEPCPYLALPDSRQAFLAGLSKKMRSNISYYDRLIVRTYPDACFSLADETTLDEGMSALFALHQARWNARWLPGVLGNARVQAFHREVARRFLKRGWLRLHLLHINGAVVSVLYCYRLRGATYYYLGGFAPDMGKFSLGTVLTARAIQHAIDEGDREFDFLRGHEPYKYRWLPQERFNARVLLLRAHRNLGNLGDLPGRAGLALNRVERLVEERAKAFSEQQGRKSSDRKVDEPAAK